MVEGGGSAPSASPEATTLSRGLNTTNEGNKVWYESLVNFEPALRPAFFQIRVSSVAKIDASFISLRLGGLGRYARSDCREGIKRLDRLPSKKQK
jgi:hypothetical protein